MERGGWKSWVTRMELVIILIPVVGMLLIWLALPGWNLFPVCSGNSWTDPPLGMLLGRVPLAPLFFTGQNRNSVAGNVDPSFFSPLVRLNTPIGDVVLLGRISGCFPEKNKLI